MTAISRTARQFEALAIPALALINFAACSSTETDATADGSGGVGSGGDSAGIGGTRPGAGGTARGAGGTAPGAGGTAPGAGGTAPGAGGTAPGAGGTAPGAGGTAPGAGGTAPGAGGTDGAGGSGIVDISDCVLPDLPDAASLPRNEKLPDPFTFFDGTPVTTKAEWECRRREIQHMAATYIYGPYPFEPDETTGTVSGNNISITCT